MNATATGCLMEHLVSFLDTLGAALTQQGQIYPGWLAWHVHWQACLVACLRLVRCLDTCLICRAVVRLAPHSEEGTMHESACTREPLAGPAKIGHKRRHLACSWMTMT